MSDAKKTNDEQTLAEFNARLVSDADLSALVDGKGSVTAFVEWVSEKLDDAGYLRAENTNCIGYLNTARGLRADAWNFDDNSGTLTLFIADFAVGENPSLLTSDAVRQLFKRVEKFADAAQTLEFQRSLDPSNPAYSFVTFIHEKISRVANVQYCLLTNKRLSSRLAKDVLARGTNGLGRGMAVNYDVWDLVRISQLVTEPPDLIVDCRRVSPDGIPCLADPSIKTGSYSACLMIVPGVFLAELYSEFHERLLEQNIRTFLQFTGGVNKGIKRTLTDEPEMFFAYNNGLTATAESVEFNETRDRILSIKNLQVVNGGQTLASIFNVWRQKRYDLSSVSVQMKLNAMNPDLMNEVVPRIALYANTQNKVSAADFSSNHPFHKRIQDFSRNMGVRMPGENHDTFWFYERVRGQYSNAQNILKTQSQKDKFKASNPKRLRFQKTDLSKFLLSWEMKPWIVSKGAQGCFGYFANTLREEWPESSVDKATLDYVDEKYHALFYKELIAKGIFYQVVDGLVKSQSDTWYKGFKANIVTYTIAKLVSVLQARGLVYDLERVWISQDLTKPMKGFLLQVAERINREIVECSSEEGRNPTEMCKREAFWRYIKDLEIPVTINLAKECISEAKHDASLASAAAKQKERRNDQPREFALEKGVNLWRCLLEWCETNMAGAVRSAQRTLKRACDEELLPKLKKGEYAEIYSLWQAAVNGGFKDPE